MCFFFIDVSYANTEYYGSVENIYTIKLFFSVIIQRVTKTSSPIRHRRITKVTLFHEVWSTKLLHIHVHDEVREVASLVIR